MPDMRARTPSGPLEASSRIKPALRAGLVGETARRAAQLGWIDDRKQRSRRRAMFHQLGLWCLLALGVAAAGLGLSAASRSAWALSTVARHLPGREMTSLMGGGGRPAASSIPSRWSGGAAEGRLLEVYRLIGGGQVRVALQRAQALVKDVPNFQLAQLVYGDLLLAQTHALPNVGNAPANLVVRAPARLDQLRDEALRRLAAMRERPQPGTIPAQFIELPAATRHAIAVDTSRSRLYLFENGPQGLHLVSDHYASIGRLGSDKMSEGDQRTPLGVYFITNRLEGRQLSDFYGVGALPLNYPNEYDRRQGRTGGGIWLHGVPSDSYARSPHSTDGCVVLANAELQSILQQIQPRNTPVVIANDLQWVPAQTKDNERHSLHNLLEGWRVAKASGDVNRLMSFYSSQFATGNKSLDQWRQSLAKDLNQGRGRELSMQDVSILGWRDSHDILVVTFDEVGDANKPTVLKRQYWGKEDGLWKIFFEGVIG